jgi:hypothetical protein
MPPPSVWGPPLWNVLHRIGLPSRIPSLQNDSEREGLWLITHLHTILPCKECRDHLIHFKTTNPIPKSYATLGEWICALHNSVNEKLGKEIYSREDREHPEHPEPPQTDINVEWQRFHTSVQETVLLRLITGEHLREFSRHMNMWIRYSF